MTAPPTTRFSTYPLGRSESLDRIWPLISCIKLSLKGLEVYIHIPKDTEKKKRRETVLLIFLKSEAEHHAIQERDVGMP